MMTNDELRAMGCIPIEDLIAEDFGKPGTPSRDRFDRDAEAFILAERLKEERKSIGTARIRVRRPATSPRTTSSDSPSA